MSRAIYQLQRFEEDEILLTENDAYHVLLFFWPDLAFDEGILNTQDREFAQALLVEAIDKSYYVSLVTALWKASANPSSECLAVIRSFATKALVIWFKHATEDEFREPEIKEMVRTKIAELYKAAWVERLRSQNPDGVDLFGPDAVQADSE